MKTTFKSWTFSLSFTFSTALPPQHTTGTWLHQPAVGSRACSVVEPTEPGPYWHCGEACLLQWKHLRAEVLLCVQAAFLLPILQQLMADGVAASRFSEIQEPEAIVVAPTRELINQIFLEARKFAFGYVLFLFRLKTPWTTVSWTSVWLSSAAGRVCVPWWCTAE